MVRLVEFPFARGDGPMACVSTRFGGVSHGLYASLNLGYHVGDSPAAVRENRLRLAGALARDAGDFVVCEQVHGGEVASVGEQDAGRGFVARHDVIPAADAMITDEPSLILAIMAADCLPILLYDPVTPAIGVAHAGWRGTVERIAGATVRAMGERFGTRPSDLRAGLGPAIGVANYEVGPEVVERAEAAFPGAEVIHDRRGLGGRFDIRGAATLDLVQTGVARDRIASVGGDTHDSEDFYSHRAGGPTGRFMLLGSLTGPGPRGGRSTEDGENRSPRAG